MAWYCRTDGYHTRTRDPRHMGSYHFSPNNSAVPPSHSSSHYDSPPPPSPYSSAYNSHQKQQPHSHHHTEQPHSCPSRSHSYTETRFHSHPDPHSHSHPDPHSHSHPDPHSHPHPSLHSHPPEPRSPPKSRSHTPESHPDPPPLYQRLRSHPPEQHHSNSEHHSHQEHRSHPCPKPYSYSHSYTHFHSDPYFRPHSAPRSYPHSEPRSYPHTEPHSYSHTEPRSYPHTEPHSYPHSEPRSYSPHSMPRHGSDHYHPSTPSLLSVTNRHPPQYSYSRTPLSTRSHDTSWTALPNGYHHETIPHNAAMPPSPSWSAGEEELSKGPPGEEIKFQPQESRMPAPDEKGEQVHTKRAGKHDYSSTRVEQIERRAENHRMAHSARVEQIERRAENHRMAHSARVEQIERRAENHKMDHSARVEQIERRAENHKMDHSARVEQIERRAENHKMDHSARVEQIERRAENHKMDHSARVEQIERRAENHKMDHSARVEQIERRAENHKMDHSTRVEQIERRTENHKMDHSARVEQIERRAENHKIKSAAVTRPGAKEVRLERWYLRVHKNSVLVAGFNKEKRQNWKSGPVVERRTAHQVISQTGAVYHLLGDMNSAALSKELLMALGEKFKSGFPTSWKLDVATVIWNLKNVKKETKEEISPIKQSEDTPDIKPKTKSEAKTPEPSSSSLGFLSSMKKSSRGRTIKPVLSTFNATRGNLFSYGYSYSGTGEVKGINTSVVDLTLDDCALSSDELFITKKEPEVMTKKPTSRKSEPASRKSEMKQSKGYVDKSPAPVSPLVCGIKFDRTPVIKIPRISCDPIAKQTPRNKSKRRRIAMPKTKKKKVMTETEDDLSSGKTVITAKKGTLKRKRQLRSTLEEMDEQHSDDIFEYRRPVTRHMKRVKISSAFLSGDDDEEEVDSCSLKCGVGGSVAALSPVSCDILTDDFDVNSRRGEMKRGRGRPRKNQKVVKQPVGNPRPKNRQLRDTRAEERRVMSLFEQTSDDDNSSDTEPAFSDMDEAYRELSKRFIVK